MLFNRPDTPESAPTAPCNTCCLDPHDLFQTACQSVKPFFHSSWQKVPILHNVLKGD